MAQNEKLADERLPRHDALIIHHDHLALTVSESLRPAQTVLYCTYSYDIASSTKRWLVSVSPCSKGRQSDGSGANGICSAPRIMLVKDSRSQDRLLRLSKSEHSEIKSVQVRECRAIAALVRGLGHVSHLPRDVHVSQPRESSFVPVHLRRHLTIPSSTMATKEISSASSTATLDIVGILSGSSLADDSLLDTRLSFSSTSTSSHSFDDVSPFSLCRKPGCVELPQLASSASLAESPLLDSSDTRDGRCCYDTTSVSPAKLAALEDGTAPLFHSLAAHALIPSNVVPGDPAHDGPVSTYVPTITVSNSIAVLPVSLESSQNLLHEVPLAIRRGKKPPPALSLRKPKKMARQSGNDHDTYPDISSAFLGSPSPGCQSPTFSFSSGDPSKFTMGLSAMCNSLKALVPPPPFTPTNSHPPRAKMEPETRWGMVSSAQLPEVDEDEWAFTQDLVVEWHASRGLSADISPPPSPAGDLPYAAEAATPVCEGFPSSTASPPALSDSSSGESSEGDPPPQTPASLKQLRRKTVIIQAPESHADSSFELAKIGKPQKIAKVLPSAAGCTIELLSDDFDRPVPFETPGWIQVPAPVAASTDGGVSTPPNSRPSSTSSAKFPVRGILKEKKSVRFSSVPSLHEYSVTDERRPEPEVPSEPPDFTRPRTPCPAAAPRRHLEPPNHFGGKHASLTAAPLRSSPLRECYSPASSGGDSHARKHQSSVTSPPTAPLPPTPSSHHRGTMAKHPAVRALAWRPQASCPSATASVLGSGEGGAVVGAPILQPPTSVLLEAQRRAPLKSINSRQRMPIQHKPDVLIPVKPVLASVRHISVQSIRPASKGRGQQNVGADGRGARVVSAPLHPRRERDENARRRSEAVAKENLCGGVPVHAGTRISGGGSRMPVPLRSILTKLRT